LAEDIMVFSRRTFLCCIAGTVSLLAPCASGSRANPLPEGRRIALRGYDPVAYFTDGKPILGSRDFWFAFDDVVYLFRSAGHRDTFAADPERFAPQYEGYCAGGISKGYKTEPDPEAWLIANGKLFVFELQDRVPMFRKTIEEVAAKADQNWPALRGK
jgi:hypothetical protein